MLRRLAAFSLRQLNCFAGLDGLTNAEDFLTVAKKAIQKTDALISGIDQIPVGPEVVDVLDEISDSVCGVADVANFCYCIHPDESWRTHSAHALNHLVKYIGKLNTNEMLFSALKAALEKRGKDRSRTSEFDIVAESFYKDFVNCGVGSKNRDKIQRIISLEHDLSMEFQRCATEHKEINALSLDDVSMLPQHLRDACVERSGLHYLAMTPAHYQNLIHTVEDESVRKVAYFAHFQSLKSNIETLNKLLKKRRQWARCLNWKSFLHLRLSDSVAMDPSSVKQLLSKMAEKVRPGAEKEMQILRNLKGSAVHQWDIPYFTALKRRHVLEELGPRNVFSEFDLQLVINGLGRLLVDCMDVEMIQLEAGTTTAVWDDSVRVFAFRYAFDEQSWIGHLYMDLVARKDKRPENAHYTLRCGRELPNGQYQTPIVALVTNFASSKINFYELRTFLHEFGHVLHSLLSRTRFQHLFGTRGPLDLVEIPSHFFENVAQSPETLRYFTGVGLMRPHFASLASLRNLIELQSMFTSLKTQEQLQIALFDQLLHGNEFHKNNHSTREVMEEAASQVGSIPHVPNTFKEAWLTHLTTYGGRYYSYIMSRHIARMAWEQNIGDDLFSKPKWQSVRRRLFKPGGAINPQEYVHDLIGKDKLIRHGRGWIPVM